jgi:hypothetical protein
MITTAISNRNRAIPPDTIDASLCPGIYLQCRPVFQSLQMACAQSRTRRLCTVHNSAYGRLETLAFQILRQKERNSPARAGRRGGPRREVHPGSRASRAESVLRWMPRRAADSSRCRRSRTGLKVARSSAAQSAERGRPRTRTYPPDPGGERATTISPRCDDGSTRGEPRPPRRWSASQSTWR